MYNRIPINITIRRADELLKESAIDIDVMHEFIQLLLLCLNVNICSFRGKTYMFKDGLAMGSPLVPLMSEIYLNSSEIYMFQNSPYMLYLRCYVLA